VQSKRVDLIFSKPQSEEKTILPQLKGVKSSEGEALAESELMFNKKLTAQFGDFQKPRSQ
jgi:hypothetical protein